MSHVPEYQGDLESVSRAHLADLRLLDQVRHGDLADLHAALLQARIAHEDLRAEDGRRDEQCP